jgi:hypothetical protein
MISIGPYVLSRIGDKVWIENTETGEAGSFPLSDLQALVEEYFGENF